MHGCCLAQVGNQLVATGTPLATREQLLANCETACTRPLDENLHPLPTAEDGAAHTVTKIIYPLEALRLRKGCELLATVRLPDTPCSACHCHVS